MVHEPSVVKLGLLWRAPFPYDVANKQGHNRTSTFFTDIYFKKPLSPKECCEVLQAQGTKKLNAETEIHE